MDEMHKVAIVILNWNGREMLKKYLPTVLKCSNEEGTVLVADNASDDGSMDMMSREFPQVRTIVLDKNYGFADGYNHALRQVEAEYYLLLNSDVEIRQERWLVPMIEYMDSHPECGACQPKLMSLHTPDFFEYAGAAGGFIDKYGYPYCRGRVFGVVEKDNGQYDDVVSLMWATGAALMVRSSDFWEAGGLDGRFFAHMEEIDLCWRMRTLGKDIVCIPESVAYHLGGATLNQGNPRKTFLNFRNNLLMLYKNLPEKELNSVMSTRWWLDMLAAMQFLVKGDVENFRAVIRASKEFKRMRPDFEADRKRNLERRKVDEVKERRRFSLLWRFYVGGKKTYKEIES
jgi:GT2 family glycosyltransferase